MDLEKEYFFQRKYLENIELLSDKDGAVLIVSEFTGNDDVSMFFKERGFEVTHIGNSDFLSLEKGGYNVIVAENLFNKLKIDELEKYLKKAALLLNGGGVLITFFLSEKDGDKEGFEFLSNRDLETEFGKHFDVEHIRTMMDGTRKVIVIKK